MMKYLIISIRPKQWYKNSLLFVCIFFSLNILNASMWIDTILAFVFFCMLSSGEYLINDVRDSELDREHPTKSKRPIASGQLKTSYATLFAFLLIVSALLGSYLVINTIFLIVSALYVVLALLYTFVFKQYIISDVLVIAIGFVIRAVAGCLAINEFISPWLIVCTFLVALFLALGKRRSELVILGERAKDHRISLSKYTPEMLDQLIGIVTGATVVSYLMYTFFTSNYYMMITIPFVVYGLFRYLFLIRWQSYDGGLEIIFKDKPMLINSVIWFLLTVLILYLTSVTSIT